MLDIGCGAGNNTLRMLQRINPLECDLVDLSMPMLTRAKERVTAVNSGAVRIFHEDFRTVPLDAERYDIIVAAAVLHHLRDNNDWQAAFEKIFRLAAPGGGVWISDFIAHEQEKVQRLMSDRYGEYLRSLPARSGSRSCFGLIEREDTPRSVAFQLDLLNRVGFKTVDVLHKNSCCAVFLALKA